MSIDSGEELGAAAPSQSAIQSLCAVPKLFEHIPLERIGPNGEYDYYGLSKRVRIALAEAFSSDAIRHLKVRQRGAMVVLLGNVSNRRLLAQIVQVSASVKGAVGVELNGVSIVPPSTDHVWDDSTPWQPSHQCT